MKQEGKERGAESKQAKDSSQSQLRILHLVFLPLTPHRTSLLHKPHSRPSSSVLQPLPTRIKQHSRVPLSLLRRVQSTSLTSYHGTMGLGLERNRINKGLSTRLHLTEIQPRTRKYGTQRAHKLGTRLRRVTTADPPHRALLHTYTESILRLQCSELGGRD